MNIIGNYKKIAITVLAIVLGVYGMNAEEKINHWLCISPIRESSTVSVW